MVVIVLGIVILAKLRQLAKTPSLNSVTPEGILILVKLTQIPKASASISVTVSAISIWVIL